MCAKNVMCMSTNTVLSKDFYLRSRGYNTVLVLRLLAQNQNGVYVYTLYFEFMERQKKTIGHLFYFESFWVVIVRKLSAAIFSAHIYSLALSHSCLCACVRTHFHGSVFIHAVVQYIQCKNMLLWTGLICQYWISQPSLWKENLLKEWVSWWYSFYGQREG